MSFKVNDDADTASSVNPTAVTVIVAPSSGFGGLGGGVGDGVGVGAGATAVGAVVPLPHADAISISSRIVQNLRLLQSLSRRVSGRAFILVTPQCGNDFRRPSLAATLRSGKKLSNPRCDMMTLLRREASFSS